MWNQIQFLCRNISDKEWSGILFFTEEGTLKKISDFTINVENIFPKSIDTAAHTSYEPDQSDRNFMLNNPEHLEYYEGIIHSHHNMDAFYSKTDLDDIGIQSELSNYYLSVIVNNKGKLIGKIGWFTKVSTVSELKYNLVGNDAVDYHFTEKNDEIKNVLILADADVTIEDDTSYDDWFLDQYQTIVEEEKKRKIFNMPNKFVNEKTYEKSYDDKDINKFLAKMVSLGSSTDVYTAFSRVENMTDPQIQKWAETFDQQFEKNYIKYFPKIDIMDELEFLEDAQETCKGFGVKYPSVISIVMDSLEMVPYIEIYS